MKSIGINKIGPKPASKEAVSSSVDIANVIELAKVRASATGDGYKLGEPALKSNSQDVSKAKLAEMVSKMDSDLEAHEGSEARAGRRAYLIETFGPKTATAIERYLENPMSAGGAGFGEILKK